MKVPKHAIHDGSHNRLVAGSNPAGATRCNDENHAVKPPRKGGFFIFIIRHWSQNARHRYYQKAETAKGFAANLQRKARHNLTRSS